MNILVCISHVPDTTSKINFVENDTQFDTNGVQFVINPNDEFGLTRAIWFKEKQGAQVHVIHVGTASSDPTLRKCLAIGADKAFRIAAYGYACLLSSPIGAMQGHYDMINLASTKKFRAYIPKFELSPAFALN